jgi:alanine racemase
MSRSIQLDGRPVWAEVSTSAILHNLRTIRRLVGRKRKILAVVKANAYGLGAIPIAKILAKAGTEWFGVTCTNEGADLRDSGIRQPILVLTGFWQGEEKRLLQNSLTPTVTNLDQLRWLERAAARPAWRGKRARVPFHVKINTGMNRLGIDASEIEAFAATLADCPHLELQGTYTHFASADDFTTEQTACQERRFQEALARLRRAGVSPGIVHLANSGAICARPSTWSDLVRPGAILYGYHQSFLPPELRAEIKTKVPLRACLSFRTRIIGLRDVPVGQAVGYGATFVTQRPSKIAVLAAGYADGMVRAFTNRGHVLLHGQEAPVVGVVSMDLSMIDVTDIPNAALGDVVTIYGVDHGTELLVSDAARQIASVTSDLLCALGQRVPRFYL